ncbi:exodeoxyribonuclease VII large subunit [Salinicoccus halitifaciens]|uniref:Exodeoxyribonuclease 7 large subunit n=1 Tax=Salinicoccus halitifaciens TaxID=1073415 RepID=A0ABV2E6H6_9STAP|nr:exodeoxyribonuclease VII large subunit [Salinicoccus halitifaciens]MCD2136913.1 exodeoxyribonuclease VII large subunit [Salinicoccus halitifaciens]
METNKYLSVKALTKYLKYKFDQDPYLRRVFVTGELSNVKHHTNGHLYFALKDGHSVIRGVMFKSSAGKLLFKPEEGQKVLIQGRISIFEMNGQYQIYADDIQIDGIGQLFEQLEKDKKELAEKGYFDSEHKKPIPKYPHHIVIVSSATSAAVKDMITTFERRYPLVRLTLIDTLVQGSGSMQDVIANLKKADSLGADVILLARGGGSIEDLWTFNEKDVAMAVFNTRTPVVTGVGHETDTTLVDYISDLRAPTPTAAAELTVPFHHDIVEKLRETELKLTRNQLQAIQYRKQALLSLSGYYKFKTPALLYDQQTERLMMQKDKLTGNFNRHFREHAYTLNQMKSSIGHLSPMPAINNGRNQLAGLSEDLNDAMRMVNQNLRQKLFNRLEILDSLSPSAVLKRGYSYTVKDGGVVKNAGDLREGEMITSHFFKGNIISKVIEVNEDE